MNFQGGFGGGFLLDQGNAGNGRGNGGNNPGSGSKNENVSPNKGQNDRKKGTMIPLTIKKLLEATSKLDDTFEVDGVPIDQAIIVARVTKADEQSTRTIFHLDDTTGQVQVAYYQRKDMQVSNAINNLDYKPNMYVKCVLVVRPFKQQKMYVSNLLQAVTDYNQVSYHMLSVFVAQAQRLKGSLPKPDQANQPGMQKKTGNAQAIASVQVNPSTDLKTMVKNTLAQICERSDTAMCRQSELLNLLKGHIQDRVLKGLLQKLESEEVIYVADGDMIDPSYAFLGA